MDNKNLPAYPQALCVGTGGDIITSWGQHTDFSGISKREMIAAMCLQGFCANPHAWEEMTVTQMIIHATETADALLTHLENTSK